MAFADRAREQLGEAEFGIGIQQLGEMAACGHQLAGVRQATMGFFKPGQILGRECNRIEFGQLVIQPLDAFVWIFVA